MTCWPYGSTITPLWGDLDLVPKCFSGFEEVIATGHPRESPIKGISVMAAAKCGLLSPLGLGSP